MSTVRLRNTTRGTTVGTAVKVAESWPARLRGLLGRSALAAGEGLLLRPCRAVHMAGMRLPVDVAFLDADGRVVAVYPALRPWRRTRYHRRAVAAVELPVGALAESGTIVGDMLASTPVSGDGS